MSRPFGLILANRATGVTRAVVRNNCVLIQRLTVTDEVRLTRAEFGTVTEWVEHEEVTDSASLLPVLHYEDGTGRCYTSDDEVLAHFDRNAATQGEGD